MATNKKATTKKATTKKATTKKATTKKATTKKATTKKATTKKATTKKATTKKATTKKATTKKATTKKATTKKATTKKAKNRSFEEELFYEGTGSQANGPVSKRTHVIERLIEHDEVAKELVLREKELQPQLEAAENTLKKLRKWASTGYFGEITGCAVGLRRKFGRVVSPLRYVIEIHVERKLSETELEEFDEIMLASKPSRKLKCFFGIPKEIDGVLVKVIETKPYLISGTDAVLMDGSMPNSGFVRRSDGTLIDLKNSTNIDLKNTVLIGGLPIVEKSKDNWGSLGLIIRNRLNSTAGTVKNYGIGNAHFMKMNKTMAQPPHEPSSNEHWTIGKVTKECEKDRTFSDFPGKYYVDASLFKVESERKVISNFVHGFNGNEFLFANSPLNNNRDQLKMKVFCFGARTQQFLRGRVIHAEFLDLKVDGQNVGKVIKAQKNDRSEFIQPGDSGTVLVATVRTKKHNSNQKEIRYLVVGVCFAGSAGDKDVLFACHFSHVMRALNLDIPGRLLRDDWESTV